MKLSDIPERIRQKPFRPFALETVGGAWVDVEREPSVLMSDRLNDIAAMASR